MKLFSGSSNPDLSAKVAGELNLPVSKSEVVRFGNSEVRVRIEEEVKNETCIVIQPTVNPSDTNLMELFFFCDALRRQEARKVIGVIPYFGYARQDIQHRPGECVSANVIIRFLESIGFGKVYTVDLHDEATEGVFAIPFKNLSALDLLAGTVSDYLNNPNPENTVVVSPDQGGIERARRFGSKLFGTGDFHMAVIEKKRNMDAIHQSKAMDLYGNVRGKTAILVDDLVTSGGTLLNAAKLCLEKGAGKVLAVVVHHDFSDGAPEKIQKSEIERFFTTNTILLKDNQKFPKLDESSVHSLIAEELKNLK